MNPRFRKVVRFVLDISRSQPGTFFWFFIRFLSAFIPLLTVYLFSQTIELIETKASFNQILTLVAVIFIIRLVDNYLRLISIYRLEECISNIGFSIHNFFIKDMHPESRDGRHESIQAIRNFADATSLTLKLIRQPGIDALVSLSVVPVILFTADIRVFVMLVAYIGIYLFVDLYTTQRYRVLKDIQNTKTEIYYAKLQDSNDISLEQTSFTRHFARLCRWGLKEWFSLQGTAVTFYSLILLYSILAVSVGHLSLSTLVLIMGYISSTQSYLNNISEIRDSLTDVTIALEHLAKNNTISVLDFDDLV